ncbi:MAG: arsenic resistance N-acetyltransferase ArsN2 [Burkholderiaceae bacterium]
MPTLNIFADPPEMPAKALLAECGLPVEDLSAGHFQHFFGCGAETHPAGIVGVEVHGTVGLLRSLAVAERARGVGCGKRLVRQAENHARQLGIVELFLLTNTARTWFESLGYETIARDRAPLSIRTTAEFSSLCPSDASLMRKSLID